MRSKLINTNSKFPVILTVDVMNEWVKRSAIKKKKKKLLKQAQKWGVKKQLPLHWSHFIDAIVVTTAHIIITRFPVWIEFRKSTTGISMIKRKKKEYWITSLKAVQLSEIAISTQLQWSPYLKDSFFFFFLCRKAIVIREHNTCGTWKKIMQCIVASRLGAPRSSRTHVRIKRPASFSWRLNRHYRESRQIVNALSGSPSEWLGHLPTVKLTLRFYILHHIYLNTRSYIHNFIGIRAKARFIFELLMPASVHVWCSSCPVVWTRSVRVPQWQTYHFCHYHHH